MFAGIFAENVRAPVSLADFAYSFSPFVEEAAPNIAVIDVEGCALCFGSAYELATVIAQQAQTAASSGGLDSRVNVALAANPDVAIHAAKFRRGITYTAPGEELTCIGGLPIQSLDYSLVNVEAKVAEEIFETLKLWGVLTFAGFANLPVAGVSERLGQPGVKLQQLAAGKTDRHLKLKQAQPVFENVIELEYPIGELEPLSFILARLLNQICASLQAYALATNELHVQLCLENKTQHKLEINLPYPMRDHKVFLKLLLLEAERNPPLCGVIGIEIKCEPVKPRLLQTGLFIPLAPEPAKLELTLARLAKLVGLENVGSPQLLDTYRPDAFRVTRFVLRERKKRKVNSELEPVNSEPQTVNGKRRAVDLGFRRFRPPLPAVVDSNHGYPMEINAWGKERSVYGKIIGLAGPWRASGEWWRPDVWARDEWDVAIEARDQRSEVRGQRSEVRDQRSEVRGQRSEVRSQMSVRLKEVKPHGPAAIIYRIYRELKNGTWYVEGIYD
ncbi:MAG TPA: hypothetical protein VJT50_08175 [Pyrinomonadaceae bacterium]|nr:hypothetical protein [Pyrinomonadaceae bacterium]